MSRQRITTLVSAGALGLLVLLFGLVLLSVLSRVLAPTHSDVVFSVTRRSFNVAAVTVLFGFLVTLFFLVRALRRHHLN